MRSVSASELIKSIRSIICECNELSEANSAITRLAKQDFFDKKNEI